MKTHRLFPVEPNRNHRHSFKNFFILVFLFFTQHLYAQTPLDATLGENSSGQLMYILLPDSSVSEIDVELGSKQGMTDLFDAAFTYDQTSGLPSGQSYSRTGLQIYLGLGNFTVPTAYFARIRLKNNSGSWSDWYEFIGN